MNRTLCLLALALLSACNGETDHEAVEAQAEEGVFDPMMEQLEKARKVEGAAMEHKEEIDEALEAADEGDRE
jgi:outer membrane biogenesis lipoprotein LolB